MLLALHYVMFLIGASRIPIWRPSAILAGVAFIGIMLNASLRADTALTLGPSTVQQLGSAAVFLGLGRVFFHQQLPALIKPTPSADPLVMVGLLTGALFLCAVLSHVHVATRGVSDSLLGAVVLHPLIFMLGVSLGLRGILTALVALLGAEFLPAAFVGDGASLQVWTDFRIELRYSSWPSLILSRLDDLTFVLLGWGLRLALQLPDLAAPRVAPAPEAPLRKAA
jgi:hypothetical protein